MKALIKKEARPGIWMGDIPEPSIGPNDVLIKIGKTAICGTDMHIYKWDNWAQRTIKVGGKDVPTGVAGPSQWALKINTDSFETVTLSAAATQPAVYLAPFEPPINIPDDQAYDIVDALYEIAQARGVSVAQVAVNWVIGKRGVTSVIFDARNMEQLQDNLNATTWRLTADEIARLDAVSAPPIPYPYWHQRKYGVGRNPLLF